MPLDLRRRVFYRWLADFNRAFHGLLNPLSSAAPAFKRCNNIVAYRRGPSNVTCHSDPCLKSRSLFSSSFSFHLRSRWLNREHRHRCFSRRNQSIYGDRARLWTAIKTNPASRAFASLITRGMHTIRTQFLCEFKALWRTRFNTQPAAFALVYADRDLASCCHRSPRCGEFHSLRTL